MENGLAFIHNKDGKKVSFVCLCEKLLAQPLNLLALEQLSSKRKRQIKLNVSFKDFEMGILHDVDILNLTNIFGCKISNSQQQHFHPK